MKNRPFLLNDSIGWGMILAAALEVYIDKPEIAIGFIIMAKLCFIHADLQGKKFYIK